MVAHTATSFLRVAPLARTREWPLIKALASQDGDPSREEQNQSPAPGGPWKASPTRLPDSPGSQLGLRGRGQGLEQALVLGPGSPHEALPAI